MFNRTVVKKKITAKINAYIGKGNGKETGYIVLHWGLMKMRNLYLSKIYNPRATNTQPPPPPPPHIWQLALKHTICSKAALLFMNF